MVRGGPVISRSAEPDGVSAMVVAAGRAQLEEELEAQLRRRKRDNDRIRELLAELQGCAGELDPRPEVLLGLVATSDTLLEGTFNEELEVTMCEQFAYQGELMDAESQIQLRTQYVLLPIRHKSPPRGRPTWPEVAARIREVLLCAAPPTTCGCDARFLQRMMRKAAGSVLSALGYTIQRHTIESDIERSWRRPQGAAIRRGEDSVRLSHMQLEEVLARFPVQDCADCIETCLAEGGEGRGRRGGGQPEAGPLPSPTPGPAGDDREADGRQGARRRSAEVQATQVLACPEFGEVVMETPEEGEPGTSMLGALASGAAAQHLTMRSAGNAVQAPPPPPPPPLPPPSPPPPEGAAPQGLGTALPSRTPAPVPPPTTPRELEPVHCSVAKVVKLTSAVLSPQPPPPAAAPLRAPRSPLKRSREEEEGAVEEAAPATMKLKDLVKLLAENPDAAPFVPRLVPERYMAANRMAAAAIKAAERNRGGSDGGGGEASHGNGAAPSGVAAGLRDEAIQRHAPATVAEPGSRRGPPCSLVRPATDPPRVMYFTPQLLRRLGVRARDCCDVAAELDSCGAAVQAFRQALAHAVGDTEAELGAV
eukprot:jgi/Tetstr1/427833/TSEL_001804.t2